MITIVFGKPRAGKTAFMVADAHRYMNYSVEMHDLQQSCISQIMSLNSEEQRFSLPEWAPVYSNFPISVPCGSLAAVESYYIDGFQMGFDNPDVPVMPVLPSARIYLSEAQRYYNSRRSKDLPDWISRFYEEHGHFGLNIMLDVQRPGLIDVNIRELCECFIEVQGMKNKYDGSGNIVHSTFYLRVFPDWKSVDKYLTSGDVCYQEQKFEFQGCVFDYYESMCYYNEFIPVTEDFSSIHHLRGGTDDETVRESKRMYQQTPPEGFYGKKQAARESKRSETIYVR